MFSNNLNSAKNYTTVGVTSGVMSASPHGLVLMLFEGAMLAVSASRMHMQIGRTAEKAQAISKAVAIIQDGLMASLDREGGGEIAEKLFTLYEYMVVRLTEANIGNRAEPLEEVGRLLAELNDAWQAIGKNNQTQPAVIVGGE
ncbi:MAG: flagellar export chaperone FliS [Betaproteobacteria bacterium]|nr:flagellar export chaperone FliS [Betaproteobacteria bacterium]